MYIIWNLHSEAPLSDPIRLLPESPTHFLSANANALQGKHRIPLERFSTEANQRRPHRSVGAHAWASVGKLLGTQLEILFAWAANGAGSGMPACSRMSRNTHSTSIPLAAARFHWNYKLASDISLEQAHVFLYQEVTRYAQRPQQNVGLLLLINISWSNYAHI